MDGLRRYSRFCAVSALVFCVSWLDPFYDEVHEGNAQFSQKKYDRAEDHYRAAGEYAPGQKEKDSLNFNLGDSRYMREDYEGAIDEFKKALRSGDPDVQKRAFFNMGNTYYKMGNIDEAINSYISSLKIDPRYEPAKKNLEYLLMEKEQDKKSGESDKQKNGKDGDKDRNESGGDDGKKDRNTSSGDDRNDSEQNRDKSAKMERMDKGQIENILKSMQNKPVRREKGTGDGRRVLEKEW